MFDYILPIYFMIVYNTTGMTHVKVRKTMNIPLGLYLRFASFLLGIDSENENLPHYTEIHWFFCSKLKRFFFLFSK